MLIRVKKRILTIKALQLPSYQGKYAIIINIHEIFFRERVKKTIRDYSQWRSQSPAIAGAQES